MDKFLIHFKDNGNKKIKTVFIFIFLFLFADVNRVRDKARQ